MTDPVIVVGSGPTGLMLACELGLAGIPVVVIDRRAAPDSHSPGQAVNAAVIELLDQRGLADELRESGLPLPGAHFSLLWLRPELLPGLQPARGLLVPQPRLEAVLERRARELGVDIRRGQELTDLRQSADSVSVRLRTAEGEHHLRGSYVVAADGTRSTVRELAGIGFPGSGWTVSGTVGDVEADFSTLAVNHLGAHYVGSGGVYSGAPAGPDVLRVITTSFAEGSTGGEPVALEQLQADVHALTGRELPARRLLWAERFTSVSGNAERYREGRIFLAGDAAHSFFPLGGLRLSTCLQDAVNLGWKLAADLQGWAPPGLLDTYHSERHPEGERARLALDAQLALMHPPSRTAGVRSLLASLAQFEDVNRYLVELVTGVDLRYPVGEGQAGGPDSALGGRTAGAAPLLRGGKGLLLVPDDTSLDLAGTAAGWADRVETKSASAAGEAGPALLRPDGHVVWADGNGELEGALKNWFGDPR
ncbi:FAD-dependent monooxygenase [Streptomyces sp. NPDC005407]|uniref:FAD-dependent monooxygenase n=1 Tax=Streptomyces sp. NPDC005407 TaxID=3155340 RepID=UPI0033A74ABE